MNNSEHVMFARPMIPPNGDVKNVGHLIYGSYVQNRGLV